MKLFNPSWSVKALVATTCMASLNPVDAANLDATIDDFSDPGKNALGIERQYIDDRSTGGQTVTQYEVQNGVLTAKGDISPPRGQPGWASTVLLLDPEGKPRDASAYKGVRLRVRVTRGNIALSANSSEITNFDFHAAPVPRHADGEFHEVRIAFDDMKRAWSEQIPLNTKTIASLSLVAVGLQKESFEYEVDDVSFY